MIYRLLILATVSNLIMSCHSGNNSFSNGSVTQLAKVATDYSLHQDPLDVTDLGAGWFRIYCEVDWPQDRSRTEVETKLIRLAESEAILAATGTSLQQIITIFESTTGGLNFTEFLREVRSGHITDRRKPHWKLITPRRNSSRHIRLALEIDLKIEALAGHSDPGFFAELSLNRQSFEPGDKMELYLVASRDCYFTVVNQCLCDYNEPITVIYPNAYAEAHLIRAGDTLRLPNTDNWELRIATPSKVSLCEEMIQVVATKTPVSITEAADFSSTMEAGFLVLERKISVEALGRWLVRIPNDQIAITMESYVTYTNKG